MLLRSRLVVPLAALLFTGIFFADYLPPIRQVHIPFDLDGFHYPLADYAFQAVKHARLPLWDPTMYSGMSFVANVQTALFYPATWLMFLASWSHDLLPYQALEDLNLAHVWLAFTLCFFWLRGKRPGGTPMDGLACALGAGIYAFSGYLCTQLQHFGLVAAYAWFPLGLWGIDQAVERRSWKPLWKLMLASAMAFLAGYPPTWFVFAFVAGIYALAGAWRWRAVTGVIVVLLASLALAAVQILPAWEATQFREPEARYGGGIKDPGFYLSYFVPNYYDFGPDRPVEANPGKMYLYLGAPGIAGLALALRRRSSGTRQSAIVAAACLVMLINPFDVVWSVIQHSTLLADLVRSGYFPAGVAIALADLSARGLDDFLRRTARPVRHWWVRAAIVAMGVWAIVEAIRYPADYLAGPAAFIDPALMLAVFGFGLYVYRSQRADLRLWVGLALLVSVGVDYKVFGTHKRFDSDPGPGRRYSLQEFEAMDTEAFQTMRAHPEYRVALGPFAPFPTELRHVGLRTPQGFDPFLSIAYRKIIDRYGQELDDRNFQLDPANDDALHLFGVRYWVTGDHAPNFAQVAADPRFRQVGGDIYYRVFEYLDARPPYGFEGNGQAGLKSWEPEHRVFTVHAADAGRLTLAEQFYPGWAATVDGAKAPVELWNTAFQSVAVPAGEHTVEFQFHSTYLAAGAWISLAALAGLIWWMRASVRAPR